MIGSMRQTILVTGGAGFIGSHTAEALLALGHDVSILDNSDPYYPIRLKQYNVSRLEDKGLKHNFSVDILQKQDLEDVFSQLHPDVVIHLAAKAGVRNSVEHPAAYVDVNVQGTVHIMDMARKYQTKKLMMASSSSVYGDNTKIPFSEEDIVESQVSPYAGSKRAMEVIAKTYARVYGLPIQLFRFFTVYGPSGRPDMAPMLFTKAIDQHKEISVFGGTASRRDYTYIDDIVAGLIGALGVDDQFEIYNLGNSTPVSLQEFIDTIAKVLQKKPKLSLTAKRVGDVEQTWADITKAKKAFGYTPRHSLEQGLQKTIDWYLKHTDLY